MHRVEAIIRRLTADAPDVALGTALVREYVEATAAEMAGPGGQPDIDTILPYVPDYHDVAPRYLVEGAAFLVAELDGEALGGVGVTRVDAATCEMNRLWVRPGRRRGGLGRALAEASLHEARALGYRRMLLDVLPSRTGAMALYRALGFREVDAIHDYTFSMVAFARDL